MKISNLPDPYVTQRNTHARKRYIGMTAGLLYDDVGPDTRGIEGGIQRTYDFWRAHITVVAYNQGQEGEKDFHFDYFHITLECSGQKLHFYYGAEFANAKKSISFRDEYGEPRTAYSDWRFVSAETERKLNALAQHFCTACGGRPGGS